jgi:hypothetical protein
VKATKNSFEELNETVNTHIRNTREGLADVKRFGAEEC